MVDGVDGGAAMEIAIFEAHIETSLVVNMGKDSRAGEIGCVQEEGCWKEVTGMVERCP